MSRVMGVGTDPILVTGASGLLGSAVVSRMVRDGRAVVGVVHRHPVRIAEARIVSVDLSSRSAIRALVQEIRPSVVIHCAALTNVDQCEADPLAAERMNADVPGTLARALVAYGGWLVHVSTDSVFDGERGWYGEGDDSRPLNAYARSKLEGERAVLAALPDRSIVVRTTIYGWNVQPKQSLAEWFLSGLRSGQRVPGFQDAIFTPMLVDDLADVFAELIDRPEPGLYHVASSDACSKYDFGVRIAHTFELDPDLVTPSRLGDVAQRAPRPRDTSLRTEKVSRHLGRQMPSIEAGVRRFRELEGRRVGRAS